MTPGRGLLRSTLLMIAVTAPAAVAEPIIASAGLLTRLIFTDNLFLTAQGGAAGVSAPPAGFAASRVSASANQAPASGMILQLLPNITGGRTARRASYRYYYGPSVLLYGGGHSDLNRIFHVFQADAAVDVVEDYVSLQVSANANQNLVDAGTGNAGFTALGNPDAFGQTASIQITPVIRLPVLRGDFATVQFAPGLNYVFAAKTADGPDNSGSTGSQSSLTITSGDYFSRAPWQIAASSNLFNNGNTTGTADGNGYGTTSVSGTVTYPLSDQWQIQGLVGYDWGNYDALSQSDGFRWRVTPYWSPSRDTTIGLGYGYRFYGTDYYANIEHRHKKTVLTASYEIDVSNARTAILDSNAVNFEDAYGQPITRPLVDQTLSGSISNPPLVAGFFIQKQLLLSIAYQFGRTTAALSVSNYHWDYLDLGSQVDQNQGSLTLSRTLSQRASGSLGLQYWTYEQSALGAVDYDQFQLWTEYSYQVNRRTRGSVRYFYNRQSSATPSQNFDENGLWLTLNWSM